MAGRPVHYVLSTHWDREWYRTFQDYRFRLVKLFDGVFKGWADGRLRGPFQTDGQAIVLEDFLEIRPEMQAQVRQALQEGKLVSGPWYVMPDEFLVSGESLIRNLKYGRQVVRHLGGVPSNAGFMCDLFGQNSQMPQLFRGFGITGAIIWRGLNQTEHMLHWVGADGTEIPAYHYDQDGYCDYAIKVRHGSEPGKVFDLEETAESIQTFIKIETDHTSIEPLLLFDGGDHMTWDAQAYQALTLLMDHPDGEYDIQHTSLDAYLADVIKHADEITTTIHGEMRDPGRDPLAIDQQWVIPGVLSSRVWIKQENAACQTLLCQWAEPLSSIANRWLGSEYPQGYLNLAWKSLLTNHPHDSICGCSIDAVHEDMKYRFHQSKEIGRILTDDRTRQLAASITGEVKDDALRLVVFNPLPIDYAQPTELFIDLPTDWPTFNEFFGYEPKPAFTIHDAAGNELPYQRLGQTMNVSRFRGVVSKFPQNYRANTIKVCLPLQIPAMGYTTLTLKPGKATIPTRYPEVPGLATSERSMCNGILAVTIESNGTLTLTDLRSGQTYERLLTFEDRADIGDGWYHGLAANDQIFYSSSASASVALLENTPLVTTFRVRTALSLPAEFDFPHMQRSDRLADLVIESRLTLRQGSDRLEVETTVHNTIGDHRLRVIFPSGAQAQTWLTDTPFDVVERPIALREDNHLYRELEVETRPQQTFSAVYADPRGLAVVSSGLLEVALQDLPERPIALTLYRSTRRTVNTDGEPNGQLFGDLTFRYWILPLAAQPDPAALMHTGQALAAGLHSVLLAPGDLPEYQSAAMLPASASFLKIAGDAILTSLQELEGGLELRLLNPTEKTITATLDFSGAPASAKPFTQAWPVDFESHPRGPVETVIGNQLTVKLTPKQILTLHFEL